MAVATLYLVHAVSIVRGMEVPLILQRLHDSREVVISIVVIIIVLVFVSSTVSGSSNAHHFCPVFFVSGLDVVVEILVFILCVQVLKALHGMLSAALLWYNQFRRDLEKKRFVFNTYDP